MPVFVCGADDGVVILVVSLQLSSFCLFAGCSQAVDRPM